MSKNLLARLSGFTYLFLILTGIFGLVYMPSSFFIWTDPAATVAKIKSSEFLFRLGVVSQILCFIAFILLPLFLYQLFKSVNKTAAFLMVLCALISVPVTFVNIINELNILLLLSEPAYLSVIPKEQINAQIMFLFASFNNGTMISNIFWGAWLLPLGYLIVKSNILPKIIGVFLILGCFGYWFEFIARFLFSMTDIPWYVSMPSSLGEFGVCLWLMILGVREKPLSVNESTI